MSKKPIAYALLFFPLFFLCLTTCYNNAGPELFFVPDPPEKTPPNSKAIVKAALYLDTERGDVLEALAQAGNYALKDSGTVYFDFIILSGAVIKDGIYSPRFEFSDKLMNIAKNWTRYIKPLQNKGIKVLVGIKGGNDGVGVGSMVRFLRDPGQKAEISEMQVMAARQIVNFCKFNGIDGVEFWDINCEIPGGRTPYPELGKSYWNGEMYVDIPEDGDALYDKSWNYGGGNFADFLCYLVLGFGAESSFQGDLDPEATRYHPILVREVNFGRRLPDMIPKFDFGATKACISYIVNNEPNWGAMKPDKEDEAVMSESGESILSFINKREYAPIIFDLENISPSDLTEYSKKFRKNADYDPDAPDKGEEYLPATPYGLVYYTNLLPNPPAMTAKLSETSHWVFGEELVFRQ